VIPQEGQGWKDGGRGDVKSELVFVHGELLNVFGKTGEEVLAVLVHRRVDLLRCIGGIDANRLGEGRLRRLSG